MNKKADYSVVPRNGKWSVIGNGNTRASSSHNTQADAYDEARRYSKNNGGGVVSVHGSNGQIREKNTIPPAHDPRNLKG